MDKLVGNNGKAPGATRSRGLERAFDIMDALASARRPLRANEIATFLGAPRSSVYELTSLLLGRGILEDAGDGRLFLGEKLYLLGSAYAAVSGRGAAVEAALKRVVSETSETAQFCRLDGNRYYVGAMREGSRPFRISTTIGERVPLTWTASGRLLVDHLTADEILAFLDKGDFALPDETPIDRKRFLSEVEGARVAGHFTFDSALDSYTHCFAVPVRRQDGQTMATLCIVAPREDARRNHAAYLETLKGAAAALVPHFTDAV
ncbi:IclR family transcriptional regulator [Tianweitania populi]|uniref:IclR family transcriptional regulator n=1 Tax=Tianweitania populi TaxID=1607949 RepID=A0A8J3DTS8_9HYPH|nr:IclR family transcriptional regulator [Tianweitania populi]GHD19473.1 IclR family transcriptional regulator [Tianweitania populi]